MALKYWYVAGNGSSNFSTAGVWFNGSGGTGGVTTTPTAADDVIIDSASGSGTLTISATSNCNSFNALTFTGTVAGTGGLNITTTTIPTNNYVLVLGGTWNYTATITFTTTISTNSLFINCNNIFHKGNMTFNSAVGDWLGYKDNPGGGFFDEPIRLTGTLGIAQGGVYSDVYAGILSSSNSGVRRIYIPNLYLSGSGTLVSATTQTNLDCSFGNLYITNTTATAKSLSIGGIVAFTDIYLQGSGASATSLTFAATLIYYPNIIISKTNGTLVFGTSYIVNLTFIEGSTITWAGTSVLNVYGNVTLCNSMSITTSNALTFSGAVYNWNNPIQYFTTFNKTFTGVLTINDFGINQTQVLVNGNYTSTSTISILSASQVEFNNIVSTSTSISITGLAAGSYPSVNFSGGIANATSLSITQADVSLGNTFLSGALTLTSGFLDFLQNSVISILTFTSSSSTLSRAIFLGVDTTINLRGSAANSWNTSQGYAQGVLYFDAQTSTVNIIDNTGSQSLTIQTGGVYFNNLHIDRSTNSAITPIMTFTGGVICKNFRDFTVLNNAGFYNFIYFTGGTTITVFDTFKFGNDINETWIYSTTTASVGLNKGNIGLAICPRLKLYNINTSNANTFYAINGSFDAGGNNQWIFNTIPRRLGSLGAG